MNLFSDHKLQKSNHSSNSARSSEQQDMLMKALGPTYPIDCYPTRACAKGLRNRFCPSVSLSVSLSVR